MKSQRVATLLILSFILNVLTESQKIGSTKVGIPSIVGFGCFNCADSWDFGCDKEKVTKPCRCHNQEFLGTVLNCINRYASGQEDILWGYSYVQTFCHYLGSRTMTGKELEAIYKNATGYFVNPPTSRGNNTRLYSPIDVSEKAFRSQYNAAATAKNQYRLGTVFGVVLLVYWGIVMACAAFLRFLKCNYPDVLDNLNGPLVTKFKKCVGLPALFHESHMAPIRILQNLYITASTRGQTIVICGYLALNLIFICVYYQTYLPNPYLTEKTDQLLKYIGNRTGIMAFTQMPLMVLFAARNNPLELITGWSLNTFQVYHHWASRVVVLHAVIHSICFTWLAIESFTVGFRWKHIRNWRFGNIALYVSILMLLIALRLFRMRFYESFVIMHRACFIIFLVGIWMHCTDFGWMAWVQSTVAIYCAEYVMRFAKMIHSGMICSADCVQKPDGTIRMSVKYSRRWHIREGQFVYIRILKYDLFWQSHPFTIFESPLKSKAGELQLQIKAKDGCTKKLLDLVNANGDQETKLDVIVEGPYGSPQPLGQYDSILLICGGIGITACYSYASALIAKSHFHNKKYTITLIWVIHSTDSVNSFKEELEYLSKHSCIIKVKLFATKEFTHVETLSEGFEMLSSLDVGNSALDLEEFLNDEPTNVQASTGEDFRQDNSHKTSSSRRSYSRMRKKVAQDFSFFTATTDSVVTTNELDKNEMVIPASTISEIESVDCGSLTALEVIRKRPDLTEEVTSFLSGNAEGTSCILTCGPPNFVDRVRYSVVAHIEQCKERVDYYEESFSW